MDKQVIELKRDRLVAGYIALGLVVGLAVGYGYGQALSRWYEIFIPRPVMMVIFVILAVVSARAYLRIDEFRDLMKVQHGGDD